MTKNLVSTLNFVSLLLYVMFYEIMQTQTCMYYIWVVEVRIVVIFGKGVLIGKEHIENFCSVGNILHLDLGDDYMGEYIYI